ncbi:CHAD domain-containing protein [Telmatobacter sp. DSM 110680]|uniref:CHAD domain-containing protein n=1 Tax=Telmatobacter sp. DSM 110680 TaxID=3036704 RepID=A0AAU7DQ60_9BACT
MASKSMRDRVAAWRRLLERCGIKATRKRVHALRVVTLRLQAELERDRTDLPDASRQAQAILRFSKQAEKLRRALSPVREFDVWIGKLRGLSASLTETGDYVPRSMQETVRGIDRLEERIKKKRNDAEIKLVAQIGKRHSQFVRASEDVDEALSEYVFGEEAGIAGDLVERFRAVKADFSTFNEKNLHEFRKRIKTVRYLAEIHASTDRACAQIATQMKKMQSAIGEWHDWQELGLEARKHRSKGKGLAELLDTVTAEAFENALSTVQMISASILGEDALNAGSLQVEGGKQPAREDQPALGAALDRQLA